MPGLIRNSTNEKTSPTKNSTIGVKALKEALHSNMSNKPLSSKPKTPVVEKSKPVETKSTPISKTFLTVHYDAGYNNALFIRGSGAGLNWEKGIQLKNTGSDTWVWETSTKFDTCEYKILLNDSVYENGPNQQLAFGKQIEHTPNFS